MKNPHEQFKKVSITLDNVYEWIKVAFYSIKSEVISNGFVKAGYIVPDQKKLGNRS